MTNYLRAFVYIEALFYEWLKESNYYPGGRYTETEMRTRYINTLHEEVHMAQEVAKHYMILFIGVK